MTQTAAQSHASRWLIPTFCAVTTAGLSFVAQVVWLGFREGDTQARLKHVESAVQQSVSRAEYLANLNSLNMQLAEIKQQGAYANQKIDRLFYTQPNTRQP